VLQCVWSHVSASACCFCNLCLFCRICLLAHCNTLQHTATHCNTLQHTATHCTTLQLCFARYAYWHLIDCQSKCVCVCVHVCECVRVCVHASVCVRLCAGSSRFIWHCSKGCLSCLFSPMTSISFNPNTNFHPHISHLLALPRSLSHNHTRTHVCTHEHAPVHSILNIVS